MIESFFFFSEEYGSKENSTGNDYWWKQLEKSGEDKGVGRKAEGGIHVKKNINGHIWPSAFYLFIKYSLFWK